MTRGFSAVKRPLVDAEAAVGAAVQKQHVAADGSVYLRLQIITVDDIDGTSRGEHIHRELTRMAEGVKRALAWTGLTGRPCGASGGSRSNRKRGAG